ncbi:MAG: Cache 3/Cache 2 fusion domain-containing protein [Marinilabiliaceae bacterium]|nr:Cache 3/Cache 2 fusion domain-containing protein [Marinilabiliaceae bacterium]
MIRLKDMKIGSKLNLLLSLVMVVIFAVLSIYIINIQANKIYADTDLRMTEQVSDLVDLVTEDAKNNQKQLEITKKLALNYLNQENSIQINSNRKQTLPTHDILSNSTSETKVNTWTIRNQTIHNNYSYVDGIKETGLEACAIFQLTPQGYISISSSIMNEAGEREIGTLIPDKSPIAQAVSEQRNFQERSLLNDNWVINTYDPIVKNNQVVGLLLLRNLELNRDALRPLFLKKKYFDSGYPFLVYADATMAIHPTLEGQNRAEEEYYLKMLATGQTSGKVYYQYKNRDKFLYFSKLETTYVITSIYVDEFLSIVKEMRLTFLIAFILAIVFFI